MFCRIGRISDERFVDDPEGAIVLDSVVDVVVVDGTAAGEKAKHTGLCASSKKMKPIGTARLIQRVCDADDGVRVNVVDANMPWSRLSVPCTLVLVLSSLLSFFIFVRRSFDCVMPRVGCNLLVLLTTESVAAVDGVVSLLV